MVSKSQLALDWNVYQPRGWGIPTNSRELPKPWFGLDTERDAKSGEFVCGFAVGENIVRFTKFTDLPPGTYWVWNLGYDAEGMLRDLNIEEAWAAKSDGSSFPLFDGTACYYHGKRFDFKAPNGKWSFIEASSFFGRCPLKDIGPKRTDLVDSKKMSLSQYLSDSDYRQKVDTYCEQDARIVFNAVNDLAKGVATLGVSLGATPGATARRFLARLPKFPKLLWQVHKVFLRSYCGGRFEITKRGVIHDVKEYDLVSAYPWALSMCPWLTDTAYSRLSKRLSPNALYGSYEVKFDYDYYLGLAPRWKKGIRVYSKSEESTWITRPELEWLHEQGAAYSILRGVEVFDENASDLWAQIIHGLFGVKQTNPKGSPENLGAKIVLNSQYGILIQLVRRSGEWVPISTAKNPIDFAGLLALEEPPKEFEAGKYYAPLYAGHLTALTRIRLLNAAIETGESCYVGGHTDSILTTGKLVSGLGDGLGMWELKKTAARADVSKTGMYALDDKVKIRGITRNGTAAVLWEKEHTRNARRSIKSAGSWSEVSLILPKQVLNNFHTENKRKWLGEVTPNLIASEKFIDSEALANVAY